MRASFAICIITFLEIREMHIQRHTGVKTYAYKGTHVETYVRINSKSGEQDRRKENTKIFTIGMQRTTNFSGMVYVCVMKLSGDA
jgi:hypothetical protein